MFLINIVVVLLLVAANAFFVASEFSLVAVRPSRIRQLREAGDSRAHVVQILMKDLDRVLSGVQHGITMASLALGWLGEITLARLFEPLLVDTMGPWANVVAHSLAVTIAFVIITALHVVLGELVPKSMALQRAEKVALLVARPMLVFMFVFKWVIDFFDGTSNFILRKMGFHGLTGHGLVHSADELAVLVDQLGEHGVLQQHQARMLEGALELPDVEVRQVMAPRAAMVVLAVNAPLENLVEVIRRHRFSRYPVYEGSPEQIIGVLHRKDLFRYLSERLERLGRGEEVPPFELRPMLREALFVPENRPLAALLEDFRHKRVHLAVVVDEFGSVQGMVTLADIMDTIVGEVPDEHAAPHAPLATSEGGPGAPRAGLVLDARISLLDLEHNYRIELPTGPGFETLAGFVLNHLGFIPQGGESFLHDGLRITVLEMEGRRVARVKIEPVAKPQSTL